MVATASPPNGKAMITEGTPGTNVTINGFDISGVKAGDQNGAAVRYQGGNLTLTNDFFHNNQEGVLGAGDPNGTITIDHSEFAANGGNGGKSHNIYASGSLAKLSITNSYFHDAVLGHEIKSFASTNVITNNRIFDNSGSSSYSIDLPRGGDATISNNVIEQGPNSQNFYMFAVGENGTQNPGTVSIDHNTIVNDRANGHGIINASPTPVQFTDNSVWSATPAPPLPNSGPVTDSGNVSLATRPTLDLSHMQFVSGSGGGGGTATPPPPSNPPPPPPPATPPPPPPMETVAQYHDLVLADFLAWLPTHPVEAAQPSTLAVLSTELNSTTVLGAIPGDLWTPHPT
ncbi:MAG TPA: right-handed parallel beta-helix repeat-containing protein [Acetobacteraceae bacterium]|nr:right-handed parallel beta-helix repeat-containing protein [Acetobacteraceae bacterium]